MRSCFRQSYELNLDFALRISRIETSLCIVGGGGGARLRSRTERQAELNFYCYYITPRRGQKRGGPRTHATSSLRSGVACARVRQRRFCYNA